MDKKAIDELEFFKKEQELLFQGLEYAVRAAQGKRIGLLPMEDGHMGTIQTVRNAILLIADARKELLSAKFIPQNMTREIINLVIEKLPFEKEGLIMAGTIFFLCSIPIIIIFAAKLWNKHGDINSPFDSLLCFIFFVSLIIISALVASLVSVLSNGYVPQNDSYEYTVRLYYLGGSEEIITVTSTEDPQIRGYRGCYTLLWHDTYDSFTKQGVVRYKILSKKKIKDLN